MEIVSIQVHKRETSGKGANRRLRAAGKVPGIFYGPNQTQALNLELEQKEFGKKLGVLEGSHLIQFESEAADLKGRMVLLREVQSHPVTGDVLHADFYEVDLTERLRVAVALHFVGKPAGVTEGGILQPILREVEVECLPTEIPEFIEVDVSPLGIHEAVHLSDLKLPEGVTAVGDGAQPLVTVLPPTVEETKPVEAAEAAPVEGAPAEGAAPAPGAEAAPAAEAKGKAAGGETKGKRGGGEG